MLRTALALMLICTPALAGDLEEARELVDAGRFEEAREALEELVEEPAHRGEALVLLTEIFNGLEDWEQGVKVGEEAVEALPESSEAHYQYAVALRIKMSNVSKMKAMFSVGAYKKELKRALELDPGNVGALTEEIGYLTNAPGIAGGDLAKAREKAIALKKYDEHTAAQMLAQIEIKDGHPEKALESMQELVEKNPEDWSTRFQLAMMLQGQKRYDEADSHFVAVTGCDDHRLALGALYQRGRSRVLGEYDQEQAVELLQQYVDKNPDLVANVPSASNAYWRMGMAYQQLGKENEARSAFEAAVRFYPDNDEAKKALKALGSS